MVPTFKETSDPIEEVFQMHTDDTTETDYSLIDTEPLDIYSRQTIYDDDVQDKYMVPMRNSKHYFMI